MIPESAWRTLSRRLAGEFQGYTWRAGGRGTWVAGRRTYRDVNREYTVSLTSWRQLPILLAILDWALERFRQEAIYLSE